MTSRTSRRPLVVAVATAILSVTLASAELLAQPPAPAQPGTPPTQPGPPPPAPPPSTPAQPTTPASSTPSEPSPGTATTPGGAPVTMTGCVKRVERMHTDHATIADVINRPMTAYVLEPSGGKADDQRRGAGLISAHQGIPLQDRNGQNLEGSGPPL